MGNGLNKPLDIDQVHNSYSKRSNVSLIHVFFGLILKCVLHNKYHLAHTLKSESCGTVRKFCINKTIP